jgi:hypothetical protein
MLNEYGYFLLNVARTDHLMSARGTLLNTSPLSCWRVGFADAIKAAALGENQHFRLRNSALIY